MAVGANVFVSQRNLSILLFWLEVGNDKGIRTRNWERGGCIPFPKTRISRPQNRLAAILHLERNHLLVFTTSVAWGKAGGSNRAKGWFPDVSSQWPLLMSSFCLFRFVPSLLPNLHCLLDWRLFKQREAIFILAWRKDWIWGSWSERSCAVNLENSPYLRNTCLCHVTMLD